MRVGSRKTALAHYGGAIYGKKEVWKDIKNYEGLYQVSNLGRIRSVDKIVNYHNVAGYIDKRLIKGEIKKQTLKTGKKGGYMLVGLWKDNKQYLARVHRLIAEAFIPNPNNYPVINHKNGIKNDNRIENLEWCSVGYNNKHAYDNNLKNPKTRKIIIKDVKTNKVIYKFDSITNAAKALNINRNGVNDVLAKRKGHHTAYGYIWEYADKGIED